MSITEIRNYPTRIMRFNAPEAEKRCCLCGYEITWGYKYHDGGPDCRAHIYCVPKEAMPGIRTVQCCASCVNFLREDDSVCDWCYKFDCRTEHHWICDKYEADNAAGEPSALLRGDESK